MPRSHNHLDTAPCSFYHPIEHRTTRPTSQSPLRLLTPTPTPTLSHSSLTAARAHLLPPVEYEHERELPPCATWLSGVPPTSALVYPDDSTAVPSSSAAADAAYEVPAQSSPQSRAQQQQQHPNPNLNGIFAEFLDWDPRAHGGAGVGFGPTNWPVHGSMPGERGEPGTSTSVFSPSPIFPSFHFAQS